MQEFRKSRGNVNLTELSKVLGVERSALEGMIDTLVRQKKLKKISDRNPACRHCAGCHGCTIAQNSVFQCKTWELVVSKPELS
jgi:hypothetical protein